MVVPKFSTAKFLEIAIVVIVILVAVDAFPALAFWRRWTTRTTAGG